MQLERRLVLFNRAPFIPMRNSQGYALLHFHSCAVCPRRIRVLSRRTEDPGVRRKQTADEGEAFCSNPYSTPGIWQYRNSSLQSAGARNSGRKRTLTTYEPNGFQTTVPGPAGPRCYTVRQSDSLYGVDVHHQYSFHRGRRC